VDPGSVIGLTFALDAVTELVDDAARPRLGDDLDVLAGKQLVRRLPDEEILYRFGHQIIRDTAYGSLLKRIRAMLHERFVTWAERVNRERGRELEFEEILGYHLEQAYHYRTELGVIDAAAREVADRAASKLSSAGRRALARSDMPAAAGLLARATALLPELDPLRIELLLDLSEVDIELGELEAAAVAVGEARSAAAQLSDQRLLARTSLSRIFLRNYAPSVMPGHSDDDATLVRDAMAALEEAGDHAGLARAWRVQAVLSSRAGRYDDVSSAAEHLIEHAAAAGEERLVARGASGYANQAVWSSQPVEELTTRIQGLLDQVHGDRKAEATIALSLAQLRAMEGQFDLARELYRRGQMLLRELGPSVSAMTTSIASAHVEVLAGDLAAAEAELRRDEADLAGLDERFYRSSIAGTLARVLLLAGKLDEAERFARVAEEIADPDDTDPQVLWRSVRSRLLALRGEPDEAIRLSDEAMDLVAQTEDIILKAEALVDRSSVLAAAGRTDAAGPALETAIGLYERKGDVISAGRVRRELGVVGAGA
jgi:tetratricopeptide (TPR) repeat protein